MVNHDGWTCPTCRRNYAPWMPSCSCINSAVGVNTASMTITPHADDTAELVEALRHAHSALSTWASPADREGAREHVEAALARVRSEP